MLICPKCKCEYREGSTICNDCKCELIEIPEATEEDNFSKKDSNIIRLIGKLFIFGVVSVVGIIILIRSINLADNEITNIMHAHGGSMDTNMYIIFLEQSIINYRTLGSILSILGGLGLLINTRNKS